MLHLFYGGEAVTKHISLDQMAELGKFVQQSLIQNVPRNQKVNLVFTLLT